MRKIRRKMAEKSQNADGGKEIKEKKEKTTQQQKGLPTLSADIKNKEKTIQQQKGLPIWSADLNEHNAFWILYIVILHSYVQTFKTAGMLQNSFYTLQWRLQCRSKFRLHLNTTLIHFYKFVSLNSMQNKVHELIFWSLVLSGISIFLLLT